MTRVVVSIKRALQDRVAVVESRDNENGASSFISNLAKVETHVLATADTC